MSKINFHIYLDKRVENKKGENRLRFYFLAWGKSVSYYPGIWLPEHNWDKKSQSIIGNRYLLKMLMYYLDIVDQCRNELLSRNEMRAVLWRDMVRARIENKSELTIDVWKKRISGIRKMGKESNAEVNEAVMKAVSGDIANISIGELNATTLMRLENKWRARGMSSGGINMYMRTLRALVNYAIKQGLIGMDAYGFSDYEIPKSKRREISLSENQLRDLVGLRFDDARQYYLDLFLMSFLLRGANIHDMIMQPEYNSKTDYWRYERSKTGALMEVKIEPEMKSLIEKYGNNKVMVKRFANKKTRTYVNSVRKRFRQTVQESLRDITGEPDLIFYSARHSWANISRKLGVSREVAAACLGHVQRETIDFYYDRIPQDEIDLANRKVIDYIYNQSK